jgi:hypothetical protein
MAGEMKWGMRKSVDRTISGTCLGRRSFVFFAILTYHRHLYVLAYVSRGLGRGGGAVNGTWLEAHASVPLEKLSFDMEKL